MRPPLLVCVVVFHCNCGKPCHAHVLSCQDLIQRSLGATKDDLQREQQARKQLEAKSERYRRAVHRSPCAWISTSVAFARIRPWWLPVLPASALAVLLTTQHNSYNHAQQCCEKTPSLQASFYIQSVHKIIYRAREWGARMLWLLCQDSHPSITLAFLLPVLLHRHPTRPSTTATVHRRPLLVCRQRPAVACTWPCDLTSLLSSFFFFFFFFFCLVRFFCVFACASKVMEPGARRPAGSVVGASAPSESRSVSRRHNTQGSWVVVDHGWLNMAEETGSECHSS